MLHYLAKYICLEFPGALVPSAKFIYTPRRDKGLSKKNPRDKLPFIFSLWGPFCSFGLSLIWSLFLFLLAFLVFMAFWSFGLLVF
jgi:hypothetical protein